jgi:hypothetical protein
MFIVHAAAPGHHWSWEFFVARQQAVERAERLVAKGEARRADVYCARHAKTSDAAQASVELGIAEHLVSKGPKAPAATSRETLPRVAARAEHLAEAL